MSRSLLNITLPLLLAILTRALPAAADDQKAGQDLPPKFEPQIAENLTDDKIRKAIFAATQYKEAVRACYPAPVYADGVLQSEAEHLHILCPFPGWQKADMSPTDGIPASGGTRLINLVDSKTSDRFTILVSDQTLINKMEDSPAPGATDKLLSLYSETIARLFGVLRYSSSANVGEQRVLSLEISGSTGNLIEMRVFQHDNHIYTCVLMCTPVEKAAMKARLLTMMKSIDFHYKPPQRERIAAIQAKVTDPADIKQQLQAVRELILCGEYRAAAGDIDKIRLTLVERIPKPIVVEDDMHYDTYGLLLTNPDPTLWKSAVGTGNGMHMMMLQKKAAADTRGMLIGVVDMIVVYGSQAAQFTDEKTPEAAKKTLLSGSARAGLANIDGKIEKEQFRTFKGMLTYEGTAATTSLPNVKVKLLACLHSDYMLCIILFADPSSPEREFKEYETILEKALTFTAK